MKTIQVSVALVTRNRPESLQRCLASVRAQNFQPYEIVVSDDSEANLTGNTWAVAERYGCHYITGPRRGLYANRNHAALACAGTHLRTMDDDHTFPAGHFELCQGAVESDPRSVWTTGETSFMHGHWHATSPTANQLHPSGVGGPVADLDDNWAIADGSTIYPRSVFARGLRMFEGFPYGSSYLEFGALLYQHGYRSRCLPGALVEHHHDLETLSRGRDKTVAASHLFASLCYNLCFRPNPLRAARHALGPLCRHASLASALPDLISTARQRWSAALTPLHRTIGLELHNPDQTADGEAA